MNQTDPTIPPAAEGLPAGTLEAAEIGASALDAWARTPHGRNFLAHALVQLARTGWLRTEPGEGFEPVQDRETPEPLPAAASDVVSPPTSRAAVLSAAERTMLTYALDQAQERIWSEGGFTDEDQTALDSLRRLAGEAHDTGTQQPETDAEYGPSAEELAGHLAAQRMSVLQGAFRILGWPPLRFELVEDDEPAPVEAHGTETQQQEPEAQRCDAGFVFGGRCVKPAGHQPPHVTAPAEQQPAAERPSGCTHRGPHPGFTCAEVDQTRPFWEGRWDETAAEQQPAAADDEETPTALRCNWAYLLHEHEPHDWEPQPGMTPVRCPGYSN
ncbi:hypothetical protein [Streptomyces naphthomycinicus]|uniref:hypothetical protein n=1 Tax=Streptomyces naphthomycinicus TaxID=2872625 RepID=UPI001CED0464|nr:hypothetical protein [Streptomyces sp. TML10]